MFVVIEDGVFTNTTRQTMLHSIAELAIQGFHRVTIENDQSEKFQEWLREQSSILQEEWMFVISEAARYEALEPAIRSIKIYEAPVSDWCQNIPALCLEDAYNLLMRPFNIILENAFTDRSFLLRMATVEQKKHLLVLESKGALVFQNGGGITEMPKRVRQVAAEGRSETIRCWLLFDSDALEPGQPSVQSQDLASICDRVGVAYHQLHRRNIENYIPRKALQAWAYNRPRQRWRADVFRAFTSLSHEQRNHYNMKGGLNSDAQRNPPPNVRLFGDLSEGTRIALCNGFDRNISHLFDDECLTEEGLMEDGCWNEMNVVVTSLLARLR